MAATKEPLLPPTNGGAQGGPTGVVMLSSYIVASIASSVLIVLCIKAAIEAGFDFPLTINMVTFLFTWLYFVTIQRCGAWTNHGSFPMRENVKLGLASVGSISFMNLCLQTNTVAIYQICKFAVIPCTLVLQKLFFKIETNGRVLFALAVILGGVGYSTIKGFDNGNLSVRGLVYAGLAVVSTAVYRIWQQTKQKEYNIGPTELQATMSGMQALMGVVVALSVEFTGLTSDVTVPMYIASVRHQGFTGPIPGACLGLLGACVMAVTVNFTSFGLIGKTGPIAYAVVGHAKTVLTIFSGIILFPKEDTQTTIMADIVGCGFAMFGVIAYGHFEYCLKSGTPDVVERCFPSLLAKRVPGASLE